MLSLFRFSSPTCFENLLLVNLNTFARYYIDVASILRIADHHPSKLQVVLKAKTEKLCWSCHFQTLWWFTAVRYGWLSLYRTRWQMPLIMILGALVAGARLDFIYACSNIFNRTIPQHAVFEFIRKFEAYIWYSKITFLSIFFQSPKL